MLQMKGNWAHKTRIPKKAGKLQTGEVGNYTHFATPSLGDGTMLAQ